MAPMTLVGLTALSVDNEHHLFDAVTLRRFATQRDPITLLRTACQAFSPSMSGTCL